ncbi:hypothetical protein B5X24_HaOG209929 [Helicoverpa armigera]|uniref:Uncharacterized protein n=1 Tax=Helicoverpa armigera TaxID=29058 RepID=A0A2W1BIY0_HELAM|nr:hypothetical protein B5X24_HaOG209929 [Helicoverpa armigera]
MAVETNLLGRRSCKGRPKLRWLTVVKKDMEICELKEEDVQDRAKWKKRIRKADPVTRRDKR